MNKSRISVFEHQILKVGQAYNGGIFTEKLFSDLQKFYGAGKTSYFALVNNGVKFCEYVGVLQIGNTLIEVLPKADNNPGGDVSHWRNLLIGMLKAVGTFDIHAPSSSSLAIKTNSILEMYFDLFIREVEYLVHSGLIKRYRKTEGNKTALKGALNFPRHIRENLVHQERFYTRHTIFDREHIWHIILYKTIRLIRILSANAELHNRIGNLELSFPEMPDKPISEKTFGNLKYTRKTECYRYAIEIARLLLLNYHPDIKHGRNDVLALMFDMNRLWETFVYLSLRKHFWKNQINYKVKKQSSRLFWISDNKIISNIRPDIVVEDSLGKNWIWDTKWKVLDHNKPSSADLMQMFAYNEFFNSAKAALVYPGMQYSKLSGQFPVPFVEINSHRKCSLIHIPSSQVKSISQWQEYIYREFCQWAED
ncbi:MAG: hypothetical protein JW973_10845 [Bacteroidales bacterium]|nr:hypothetical protein [Bacteroidales bacterium]